VIGRVRNNLKKGVFMFKNKRKQTKFPVFSDFISIPLVEFSENTYSMKYADIMECVNVAHICDIREIPGAVVKEIMLDRDSHVFRVSMVNHESFYTDRNGMREITKLLP
jgi:hypothetical protein